MTIAELAILGLVAEAPCHGYEIERHIVRRGVRNWTEIGFSSIYYLLSKLEAGGYIASRTEPAAGRGPARKVFEIQPAGRDEWQKATLEALTKPSHTNSSFMVGLAGLPGLRAPDAAIALRQHRVHTLARKNEIEEIWQQAGDVSFLVEGMYEYTVNLLQTELDWLDRYIPRLENLAADDFQ